jgi:chemotaxis protein CheD
MAHIMLPSSKIATANTNRAKFADTGIVDLLEKMTALGAERKEIVSKIAGGAQMFNFAGSNETLRKKKKEKEEGKERKR